MDRNVLKLEFGNGISDRSYFYLIGKIRLTDSEIVTLCDHIDESAAPLHLSNSTSKKRSRKDDLHSEDEDYREILSCGTMKKRLRQSHSKSRGVTVTPLP